MLLMNLLTIHLSFLLHILKIKFNIFLRCKHPLSITAKQPCKTRVLQGCLAVILRGCFYKIFIVGVLKQKKRFFR